MRQDNPILILDDDLDDLEMIKEAGACIELSNTMMFFKNGEQLKQYLKDCETSPFLILCDVNMGGQSGFEVRKMLMADASLKYKSVPFIFWSTNASEKQIQHAYDLPAQGFFFKSHDFTSLCETLKTIVEYWKRSQHPKKL